MKKLIYLICISAFISCIKKPSADFSYSNSTEIGDTIFFSNLSENVSTYDWNFGDGYSSNKKSPSHYFTKPGTYSVLLKVGGAKGSASLLKSLDITGTTYSFTNFSQIILPDFFSFYLNGSTIDDYLSHGTLYIGSASKIIITKRSQIYAGFTYDGSVGVFVNPFNLSKNKHNDLNIGRISIERKSKSSNDTIKFQNIVFEN